MESTSLLIFFLLTYLIESNLFTKARPIKKIKINKKVPSAKDKDRVTAMTPLL